MCKRECVKLSSRICCLGSACLGSEAKERVVVAEVSVCIVQLRFNPTIELLFGLVAKVVVVFVVVVASEQYVSILSPCHSVGSFSMKLSIAMRVSRRSTCRNLTYHRYLCGLATA